MSRENDVGSALPIALGGLLVGFLVSMLIGRFLGLSIVKEENLLWCSKNYELYSEVQACIRKGPHKIPEIKTNEEDNQ
jgi:hypothetical protein